MSASLLSDAFLLFTEDIRGVRMTHTGNLGNRTKTYHPMNHSQPRTGFTYVITVTQPEPRSRAPWKELAGNEASFWEEVGGSESPEKGRSL